MKLEWQIVIVFVALMMVQVEEMKQTLAAAKQI